MTMKPAGLGMVDAMHLWVAMVLGAVAAIAPQSPQDDVRRFFSVYQARSADVAKAGNVLGHLVVVEDLRREYAQSRAVQDFTRQLIGTLYSFLGQDARALAEFDALPRDTSAPPAAAPSLEGYDAVSAVDAIVTAAASHRAVFINEAHHVPRHRVLTLQLLAPLYAQGFRYFAAETFARTDPGLNTRGYPTRATGYYSQEPVFGALVREAVRLGYTLVPYEPDSPADQDAREQGQARNLYARIFESDPQAKVLVHAGYDHINESGGLGGVPAMAERFKQISGIDPLTVDQTAMTERSAADLESPLYRRTEATHRFTAPTVFRRGTGLWALRSSVNDVTVFMPRTTRADGRPAWLLELGRQRVRLPDRACPSARCAVFAWIETEPADAVPVDALLIDGPGSPRTLLLPAGAYRIESRDAAGSVLQSWRETVAGHGGLPDTTHLDLPTVLEHRTPGNK